MKVEVVGGPHDGTTYEVPDDMQAITFPVKVSDPVFDHEDQKQIRANHNDSITLHIVKKHNGKHIVVWQEL